ncbi:MAG: hypothetical protein U1F41_06860 [Burkholderiales bacterium]
MSTIHDWTAAVQRAAKRAGKQSATPPPVVKESSPPAGWRFTPYRDDTGLIIEIIATPIQ